MSLDSTARTRVGYLLTATVALLAGLSLGYRLHPTLTLFCPGEMIDNVVEADAPLSQLEGWVEFKKFPCNGFFCSWDQKVEDYQRLNCSAFLYK